jgi:site-specific recombinase XerD
LAKASKENCLWATRRFLGFLANGEPTALEVAPAKRLTIDRVRHFVSHLAETSAPQSVASLIEALYQAARFTMPETDWSWLKKIKSRLHTAAPAKSRAGQVITSVQLLDLGLKLMDEVEALPNASFNTEKLVQFRDGLMVAFLAFIPIRPRNLVGLEIGRQVVLEGDRWFITIPGRETKTGTDLEFPLPEILIPYLTFYLNVLRPRMIRRANCAALWVSASGSALTYVGVVKSLQRLSKRLGIQIAPHDARDAAATTWAISAPTQISVARDLLAHSDLRTTNKHYNRARGIEASRAYGRAITIVRRRRNRGASAGS